MLIDGEMGTLVSGRCFAAGVIGISRSYASQIGNNLYKISNTRLVVRLIESTAYNQRVCSSRHTITPTEGMPGLSRRFVKQR